MEGRETDEEAAAVIQAAHGEFVLLGPAFTRIRQQGGTEGRTRPSRETQELLVMVKAD